MKTYSFALHYVDNLAVCTSWNDEKFCCDADAMMRARKILKEGKRDANAFLVCVYKKVGSDFRHVVSYQ